MRIEKISGFKKLLSAAVIVMVSLMAVTCDDNKKDNIKQLLPLFLLYEGSAKLLLYNAGAHDGNPGGRSGADAICNASGNKPAGVTKVHAFISINDTDEIRDMPANYGYPANFALYGPNGTSKIADDWNDLLDGSIVITLFAAGVLPNSALWWSGSSSNGSLNVTCNGFRSNNITDAGQRGWNDQIDSSWIENSAQTCNDTTQYVLCIGKQ